MRLRFIASEQRRETEIIHLLLIYFVYVLFQPATLVKGGGSNMTVGLCIYDFAINSGRLMIGLPEYLTYSNWCIQSIRKTGTTHFIN